MKIDNYFFVRKIIDSESDLLELFQNLTGPFFCDAVYSYVALVLAVARFFLCKMKSCLLHF